MKINPWLEGFTRVYNARATGMTYESGYPSCIVSHSMEDDDLTTSDIERHPSPPHFWVDIKGRKKYQSVILGRGSYAMGGDFFPTNRKTDCVQIEIEGRAVNLGTSLTEDDYKWYGEEVLRPICEYLASVGNPINYDQAPDCSTEQISGSSFANAPQRFSLAYWLSFNGHCGHRHVTGQSDRYDPGLMDCRKPLLYAKPNNNNKPVISNLKDDDMLRWYMDSSGTQYAGDGLKLTPMSSAYAVSVLQASGTLMTKEQMEAAGFVWNIDRESLTLAFQIQEINESVSDKPF